MQRVSALSRPYGRDGHFRIRFFDWQMTAFTRAAGLYLDMHIGYDAMCLSGGHGWTDNLDLMPAGMGAVLLGSVLPGNKV